VSRPPAAVEALLRTFYAAFNRRDIEAVVPFMDPEVDWPNMLDGTRLVGPQAVRAYWLRQFETTEPHVEPEGFAEDDDGRVVVAVHQIVRDRASGAVLADTHVQHVYELRDEVVVSMEVRS